jgi:hypothetical protein
VLQAGDVASNGKSIMAVARPLVFISGAFWLRHLAAVERRWSGDALRRQLRKLYKSLRCFQHEM